MEFKEFANNCPWNCKTGNAAHTCGVIKGQHGEPGPCWEHRCGLWYSKRPPNTQTHMDKEPCSECEQQRKNFPWPPFCKWCGRALS